MFTACAANLRGIAPIPKLKLCRTDYHRVLHRKDIDAVVVSVSDHWYTPILIDAVTAGKDVYLEYP